MITLLKAKKKKYKVKLSINTMLMNEVKKKNQLKKEQKKLAESTCVNLPNSSHKTNITQ
jgi:hypothetical protein